MSSSIWTQCGGESNIRRLTAMPWRAVEAQHQVVTRKLVDTLEEQILLEQLLEHAKPPLPNHFFMDEPKEPHYLLATPFRYPPLKYGSRFGTKAQRGIWYGSANIKTSLAEVAYYRFLFIEASDADLGAIFADFTIFRVCVKTSRGIDLTREPFMSYKSQLIRSSDYLDSQALGSKMRESGVAAFRYYSARQENGINIAMLNAQAFDNLGPLETQRWHCVTGRDRVDFVKTDGFSKLMVMFHRHEFAES